MIIEFYNDDNDEDNDDIGDNDNKINNIPKNKTWFIDNQFCEFPKYVVVVIDENIFCLYSFVQNILQFELYY